MPITSPAGGSPRRPTPAEVVDAYRRFAAEARGFGITAVQLIGECLPVAEVSKHLVDADVPMRWRVFRFPMREDGGETIDSRPPLPPQPAPLVDVRGMKWILDGTPIERLGFMRAPYRMRPASGAGSISRQSASSSSSAGRTAARIRSRCMPSAMARSTPTSPRSRRPAAPEVWRAKRPRIEHGDMMPPDLIARVKAMGMVVVQNPLHFMSREIFAARCRPGTAARRCSR